MNRNIILSNPDKYNSFYPDASTTNMKGKLIFVFGSNLKGVHGAGAAKYALQHMGAIYGKGIGLQGQSYAIPTKDLSIRTLPLDKIQPFIRQFIEYSKTSGYSFFVTAVGTGLAGHSANDIAPMFAGAQNCWFPQNWEMFL